MWISREVVSGVIGQQFRKLRHENEIFSLIVKWLSPLTLNQVSPVRIRVKE